MLNSNKNAHCTGASAIRDFVQTPNILQGFITCFLFQLTYFSLLLFVMQTQEYIPGRFGHEESRGYAAFPVQACNGHDGVTLSMFVRTRKPSGLLLALKNNTSLYLKIWLEDGKLMVSGPSSNKLIGKETVNDGRFCFVLLKIQPNKFELFQSAQNVGYISTPAIKIQSGDILYAGGLPDEQETDTNGGYFKGCIQDLRLNNQPLEFFPVLTSLHSVISNRTLINIAPSCTGDNLCKVRMLFLKVPCQCLQQGILFCSSKESKTGCDSKNVLA